MCCFVSVIVFAVCQTVVAHWRTVLAWSSLWTVTRQPCRRQPCVRAESYCLCCVVVCGTAMYFDIFIDCIDMYIVYCVCMNLWFHAVHWDGSVWRWPHVINCLYNCISDDCILTDCITMYLLIVFCVYSCLLWLLCMSANIQFMQTVNLLSRIREICQDFLAHAVF